jgi:hypothetical protein
MSHLIKSGVIKSRIDHRDYEAEAIFHEEKLAGSPASPFVNKTIKNELFLFDEGSGAELTIAGNAVMSQGSTFRCVAYVGCTIREYQVYNEMKLAGMNNTKVTFSKDYIYDLRTNAFTDGMSGADLMQILVKWGCVEECDYDQYLSLYNSIAELGRKKRTASQSTIDALDEMIHDEQNKINDLIYRIKTDGTQDVYAKVTTVNGLKESLAYNGPCLIILPFYGNPDKIQFWVPPSDNAIDEMGHAVTVVGYSDSEESFYLRNTWGPSWNGTGHVWFPYSSLRLAWETWTVFPRGTEHLSYHKKRNNPLYAGAPLKSLTMAGASASDSASIRKKSKKTTSTSTSTNQDAISILKTIMSMSMPKNKDKNKKKKKIIAKILGTLLKKITKNFI